MIAAVESAQSPSQGFSGYLRTFGALVALALAAVGVFNYVVDPYLVFHLPDDVITISRPNKNRLSPLSKSLAIARLQPSVVYVGNSRTEVGLPTRHEALGTQRAFNGALTGASVADAIMMARHAMAVSDVNLVVMGVDFWTFSSQQTNPHFDRVLVGQSHLDYLWRGPALQFRHALSWDTTLASLSVVRRARAPDCPSFLSGAGQRDPACMVMTLRKLGGPRAAFEYWIRTVDRREQNSAVGDRAKAIEQLGAFIDDACRAKVTVRIYVNPTHALMLDTLRLTGQWGEFESWKRALVEEVARHPQCEPHLLDFSGYNSVTSEPSPLVTGQEMRWFWEASHYRSEVGDLILAQVLGAKSADAPSAFGIELDRDGLEQVLSRGRLEQRDYLVRHAEDVAALERMLSEPATPAGGASRSAAGRAAPPE